MRVSIFGLGYVGAVTAGCLTKEGHTVVGVDVQAEKVESLASGVSPIVEPGLSDLLTEAAKNGLLSATQNHEEAIAATGLSLVCVGTPSAESGELNLQYVWEVVGQIADAVRATGEHRAAQDEVVRPARCTHRIGNLPNNIPDVLQVELAALGRGRADADKRQACRGDGFLMILRGREQAAFRRFGEEITQSRLDDGRHTAGE